MSGEASPKSPLHDLADWSRFEYLSYSKLSVSGHVYPSGLAWISFLLITADERFLEMRGDPEELEKELERLLVEVKAIRARVVR